MNSNWSYCPETPNLGQIRRFFLAMWSWNLLDDNRAPLLYYFKLRASFRSHWWIQTGVTVRKCPFLSNSTIFRAIRPSNLTDDAWPWKTIEHLLYSTSKLCASFRSNWGIQTWVIVRKRPIGVKLDFFSRVTLKFDGWPRKTIEHLFNATSCFVHHFVALGESKLELQSGNSQSGSNSTIFKAVLPWNLTDDLEKQ